MAKTVLKKDRTVTVKTKTGGSYSYAYSTLAEIHKYLEETNQRYKAHIENVNGVDYMFIKQFDGNGNVIDDLKCARVPAVSGVQEYGGVLTSIRRFSLLMAYGLACEESGDNTRPGRTQPGRVIKERQGNDTSYRVEGGRTFKPSPNKPASEKQIEAIRTLGARAGKTLQEINAIVDAIKSSAQASAVINKLGEEVAKRGEES